MELRTARCYVADDSNAPPLRTATRSPPVAGRLLPGRRRRRLAPPSCPASGPLPAPCPASGRLVLPCLPLCHPSWLGRARRRAGCVGTGTAWGGSWAEGRGERRAAVRRASREPVTAEWGSKRWRGIKTERLWPTAVIYYWAILDYSLVPRDRSKLLLPPVDSPELILK